MASFMPRSSFPNQLSLPRSYFLGHHASGLSKMKTMLSSIDLIIECRDYRVPLTSRNPLFEQSLAGRERLILYTKRDLGSKGRPPDKKVGYHEYKFMNWLIDVSLQREDIIRSWHSPSTALFTDHKSKKDIQTVLNFAKEYASHSQSIMGLRILVVGMPNVGKSSLLNALRMAGVHRAKAAFTGAQPGVTRKVASGVKIVDKDEEKGIDNVYLVDTPGVFIPYVADAESMLKLALVGSVKDTIIAPVTLADYLLFHINKNYHRAGIYEEYCPQTNDVVAFLEGVCRKTGRLGKGGVPDLDAAALWIIQRWRQGNLGTFVLDEVTEDGLEKSTMEGMGISLSQARKQRKKLSRAKASEQNLSSM
jgi:mitochondrial GTPase 1